MKRLHYFIKRLLLIIPTLLGITIVCFFLCQFVPGGPVDQMVVRMRGIGGGGDSGKGGQSSKAITEKQKKEIEAYFGFDKPVHVRYWLWLKKLARFDLGDSYKYPHKTAWQLIRERFSVSLIFGLTGFLLHYIICIPLGIKKALSHGSRFDLATSVIIFIGYSIPAFAFGMLLKMLFCGATEGLWDIFPIAGFVSDNYDQLSGLDKAADIFKHMFLPVLCYVIGAFAVLTVLMKNSLMEQISSDYMRTALAKGCDRSRAVWRHAFRNSLIPIATGFGGFITLMFAGSVLIEKVFSIPGMGALSLEAITGRDYNVFMGLMVVQSFLGLLGNIISDLSYILIDPRITFDR